MAPKVTLLLFYICLGVLGWGKGGVNDWGGGLKEVKYENESIIEKNGVQ